MTDAAQPPAPPSTSSSAAQPPAPPPAASATAVPGAPLPAGAGRDAPAAQGEAPERAPSDPAGPRSEAPERTASASGTTGGGGLLVVGDVVTDVVALHSAPVAAGTDTAADIALRPGGSGANTACWAAHLGADTRLLTRLGYDSSEWHTAELVRAGVRPYAQVDPAHPTAVVIAMVDATGERSMLTNRGAGGRISPADWDDAFLDGVALLHLSGYTFFTEPGLALARLAMERATAAGIAISVDPASTGPLREFGVERFLDESAPARLIIPNRDEALVLTGVPEPERAAELLSERYGTAVVKLGSKGALSASGGRIVATAEGVPVHALDTTGAGDAFAAGYLTARLNGDGEAAALRAGCQAGAECVALVGGRPRYGLEVHRLYPIHAD
ncbi:carbohydrate kinase family protein [Nonomuraea roseoviolacea]|uniref:Sugar/nucleoside kinase (Ribokinase family) n=1 Tax=Nonomuraea roseoviolacea subsp. carminata TaxID=160689 RepID=A0ABT1K8F9_9ACTN|nr:sugar kinase [Nonomuraea roseoviolacea]MCP2350293.1 sugar/nucleoside kinase (ribokinase family) [Nonomuraea roseoviolacea subsp. carminata]